MRPATVLALAMSLALGACDLARNAGFGDGDVVSSPTYSNNRVMLLEPTNDNEYSLLRYPAQRTATRGPNDTRQAILNRQPLSIIVSKVYLPASLRECVHRTSDAWSRGRDIAVLLDTATASGTSDALAVWYERGVRPGSHLTFENLLVYSTSAWDSRFPPYFRIRLIDVTGERNAATRVALNNVKKTGPLVATLLSAPAGSQIITAAADVGALVLANERNEPLLDFTFQLYGDQLASQAGGGPLGILQTGGMVLTAPACAADSETAVAFPRTDLRHDNYRFELQDMNGAIQEMPFVYATIVSADMAVPDVVRTRSSAIMTRLAQPTANANDIDEAIKAVTGLNSSLGALAVRERFRTTPNLASLTAFADAAADFSGAATSDASVSGYLLTALYQATGKVLDSPAAYKAWLELCGEALQFDIQRGRAVPNAEGKGTDGEACWSANELS